MTYTPPLSQSYFQDTSFGSLWLNIADTAYIQQGSTPQVIFDTINFAYNPTNGQTYVPNPPDPSNKGQTLSGYWNVDWGPAITNDNSNLVMVVSFRQGARPTGNDPQGAPYFFAVSIRGTDISADDEALLQQILQDFNAYTLQDLTDVLAGVPNPAQSTPPGGMGSVATGTAAAFTRIANLDAYYTDPSTGSVMSGGVAAALLALLGYYPQAPLVVTGHSLGGCQTQIMAAYLGWQLASTATAQAQAIYPNAYAPSTAGNAAFAAYYSAQFPYGQFWLNTLDVVPCGFSDLEALKQLWNHYKWPANSTDPETGHPIAGTDGPASPELLRALDDVSGALIKARDYQRPSVGVHVMAGSLPTPQVIEQMLVAMKMKNAEKDATSGIGMLMYQHFMEAYNDLVDAVGGVIPYGPIDDSAIPVQDTAVAAQ